MMLDTSPVTWARQMLLSSHLQRGYLRLDHTVTDSSVHTLSSGQINCGRLTLHSALNPHILWVCHSQQNNSGLWWTWLSKSGNFWQLLWQRSIYSGKLRYYTLASLCNHFITPPNICLSPRSDPGSRNWNWNNISEKKVKYLCKIFCGIYV